MSMQEVREVLLRIRSVLVTCLGDEPADLEKAERRLVIERRIREITEAIQRTMSDRNPATDSELRQECLRLAIGAFNRATAANNREETPAQIMARATAYYNFVVVSDSELRQECLQFAIGAANRNRTTAVDISQDTTEQVLARAQAYFDFVTGAPSGPVDQQSG